MVSIKTIGELFRELQQHLMEKTFAERSIIDQSVLEIGDESAEYSRLTGSEMT